MAFRLADMDVRWSGVDDTTPPGHCLASGLDPLGNLRVWLFQGDAPSDAGFCGSLLIPADPPGASLPRRTTAYGPGGGYVTSTGDQAAMLARLAERAAR